MPATFEIIPLDSINESALRDVTFGSVGVAESFLRTFLASGDARVALRLSQGSRSNLRRAVCKVSGATPIVKRNKGEQYVGKDGTKRTAKVAVRAFTAEQYRDAIKTLALALREDGTSVVGTGAERVASYVLTRTDI